MTHPRPLDKARRRASAIRAVVSAALNQSAALAARAEPLDQHAGNLLVAADLLSEDLLDDIEAIDSPPGDQ